MMDIPYGLVSCCLRGLVCICSAAGGARKEMKLLAWGDKVLLTDSGLKSTAQTLWDPSKLQIPNCFLEGPDSKCIHVEQKGVTSPLSLHAC